MFYHSADDYVDAVTFEGGPITFEERKTLLQSINQFVPRRRLTKKQKTDKTTGVYKYQDKTSKSVEYISVEELLTSEWKDVVSPTIAVIQNNDKNLHLPKVPVHNSNNETKQKVHRNVVNNSIKRKSSYTIEVGPAKSIFDVVPLEKGSKRNRKIE